MWFGSYCCNKLVGISCHEACLLTQLYYMCPPCTSLCCPSLTFSAHAHCLTGGEGEIPWCFSQVKGTIEDEVADGKSTVCRVPMDRDVILWHGVVLNFQLVCACR